MAKLRLENKIAFITGGNSGIGLATARLFVREGAAVILTGRNQTTLNAVAEELAGTSEETFDQVMRTNVTGVFLTVQAALPLLREGSSVILNGSIGGEVGFPPGAGFYSASKAAISGLSRSIAAELSPRGIRVNVVAPGFTKTPMVSNAPKAMRDKIQTGIPLNRWAEAEEIAKAVLFLASDDSSYVNISEIVVDGGFSGALFAAPNWRS